ncbi:unnamed protein product [Diatraea saccharalis]|uniref:Uncharacterized protein n=1 Tax=Diatraea saccharalis TaxID=40085 RepID=A0A9N9W593_9NEOP|nr:unnamed protein product [Diatraea saccharalis]
MPIFDCVEFYKLDCELFWNFTYSCKPFKELYLFVYLFRFVCSLNSYNINGILLERFFLNKLIKTYSILVSYNNVMRRITKYLTLIYIIILKYSRAILLRGNCKVGRISLFVCVEFYKLDYELFLNCTYSRKPFKELYLFVYLFWFVCSLNSYNINGIFLDRFFLNKLIKKYFSQVFYNSVMRRVKNYLTLIYIITLKYSRDILLRGNWNVEKILFVLLNVINVFLHYVFDCVKSHKQDYELFWKCTSGCELCYRGEGRALILSSPRLFCTIHIGVLKNIYFYKQYHYIAAFHYNIYLHMPMLYCRKTEYTICWKNYHHFL